MGYLVAAVGSYIMLVVLYYVLYAVACWKIFAKAGQAGWKAFIPVYNAYILYKISWTTTMFWVFAGLAVVLAFCNGSSGGDTANTAVTLIGGVAGLATTVISVLNTVKTSKAFGKGIGFALGLIFLRPVFLMILGFGSAQYQGPQA